MTGLLGQVDLPAPIDDRWFKDYIPGSTSESDQHPDRADRCRRPCVPQGIADSVAAVYSYVLFPDEHSASSLNELDRTRRGKSGRI